MGIAVLGRLAVDESEVGLGSRDRVVLSVLAMSPGEVVSADRLADALWGDELPATWTKVIQGCVMRLRKLLGSQAIATSHHGYRLVLPSDEIDSRRFERLVGRGRELLSLGEPERACFVLDEAMSLWRGPAFVDLDSWDTARVECERLDELRRTAEELGIEAELRSGRAPEVIARAQALVAQAPLRERRWWLLALAQYQAGRQSDALHSLREVRGLLGTELGLDPGPEIVDLEQAILRQDPTLLARMAMVEPSQTCPYLGLVPYDVAEGDVFFGRGAAVAQCLQRLAEQGALVVVGPSGSGKSSLVRAGVASALQRDGRRVVVMTPGVHPMDMMTAVPSGGRRPTLVVDQLEEAVTLCGDATERAEFFRELVDHAETAPLIIALRADHMSDLAAYPPFARLVERGLYLLGDMEEGNLRACIEGPARQAGLLLEPGLVDLLVREVEGEPGALPLLSHALRQTWAHREGRTLTVAGYTATGGIRGAVSRTAEEVYARVDPGQRALMRGLLLRLVVPTADGDPVRNRMPRRMVAADAEHEQIIERLVTARLVTSDDGVLVLAHEAVARAWPRLQQWLEEDTEGQRILRHLPVAADAWKLMGRPDSELYRGSRLARAVEWRDRTNPRLSSVEREFLDASTALADSELRAARERASSEARARRRTRRLALGLAVALVIAVLAAGLAIGYQRAAQDRATEADSARTVADANRLAALSTSARSLDLSLLLAGAAMRTARTPETEDGLLGALLEHRHATAVHSLGDNVEDTAVSAGGRTLFATLGGATKRVVSWRVGSPHPAETAHQGQIWGMAASPAGEVVAVTTELPGGGVGVRAFSRTGDPLGSVRGPWGADGFPIDVAYTADGRLLALVSHRAADGSMAAYVTEVDLREGAHGRLRRLGAFGPADFLWGRFTEDGQSLWVGAETDVRYVDLARGSKTVLDLATHGRTPYDFLVAPTGALRTWSDGAFTRYDAAGRQAQLLEAHTSPVIDVAVAPDGRTAVTVGGEGEVVLWDIAPGSGDWTRRDSLVGHEGEVSAVEVSPDGKMLSTISLDGTLISWDLTGRSGFGGTYGALGDRWISRRIQVVEDGRVVVAPTRTPPERGEPGSGHVGAAFLNPRTGREIDSVAIGPTDPGFIFGSSAAVSPDRSRVAVTHTTGTAIVDARSHEVVGRITLPGAGAAAPGPAGLVWSAAWTPDGSHLVLGVSGSDDDRQEHLALVDADSLEVDGQVRVPGEAGVLEWSPDRTTLAVGISGEAAVAFLDRDLELVRTVAVAGEPFDLAWSPDGARMASAGDGGNLSVIDAASGELVRPSTKLFGGFIADVEWLPGSRVAASGDDGAAAIYDVARDVVRTGALPASDRRSGGYAFMMPEPTDELIVLDGLLPGHRYPLDPAVWLAEACRIVGRDFTPAEWRRYVPTEPFRPTCSDLPSQKGTAVPESGQPLRGK